MTADPEWGEMNEYRVTFTYVVDAISPDDAMDAVMQGEAPDPDRLVELLDGAPDRISCQTCKATWPNRPDALVCCCQVGPCMHTTA